MTLQLFETDKVSTDFVSSESCKKYVTILSILVDTCDVLLNTCRLYTISDWIIYSGAIKRLYIITKHSITRCTVDRRGPVRLSVWKGIKGGHLQHLGSDRILLKLILNKYGGGRHWMNLPQDRDKRRTFANAVMNIRFPYIAGNFVTKWETIGFPRRKLLYAVS